MFASFDSFDSCCSFDSLDSSDSFDVFDCFNSFDSFDAFNSFVSLDSFDSFDLFDSFDSFASCDSFDQFYSFVSFDSFPTLCHRVRKGIICLISKTLAGSRFLGLESWAWIPGLGFLDLAENPDLLPEVIQPITCSSKLQIMESLGKCWGKARQRPVPF